MIGNGRPKNAIRVGRIFDANVKLIWKAWTEPAYIKRWFGSDPDGTVEEAVIDLKVGGSYRIRFSDSDGSQHTCFGRFLSVVPNNLLVYSWEWESEPGHVSEVHVSFQSIGDKTRVVLEHKNLNPDSTHIYDEGWSRALNKIEPIIPAIIN